MEKSSFLPRLRPFVAPLFAAAAAFCVIQLQFVQFDAEKAQKAQAQSESFYQLEEQQIKANAALLKKIPSFGHDNLVADWAFLSFVQYFGDDKARNATGYSATPSFFETVVKYDPLFLEMYPYLSSGVTLFALNPTKTIELLQQGINAMPDSMRSEAYFLWQSKATDELLFLGNPTAAQASYEKAAEWASLSDQPELQAIAARSRKTAAFLAENPDSRSAQIASWYNVLSNAVDDQTRALAFSQIQSLGGRIEFSEEGQAKIFFPES